MIIRNTKYLALTGLLLLLAAFNSVGHFHADEHFQILEFAEYKLGNIPASALPWEFEAEMRPAFQPFLVFALHSILGTLGIADPFTVVLLLRILTALMTFGGIWLMLNTFSTTLKDPWTQKMFALASCFLWFVPFLGVRYSSEAWSGIFFLYGFVLYHRFQSNFTKARLLLLGIFFGLSFLCRYQAGFMIFGMAAWLLFIKKENFKSILWITLGGSLVFGLGLLLDKWFYGTWTCSAWNYFTQNVVNNKAASFGIEPPWFYLERGLIEMLPPVSLFVLLAVLYVTFRFPKSSLTWVFVPFLLAHHLIGHKEFRFLFPMAPFAAYYMALTLEQWQISDTALWRFTKKIIIPLAVVFNTLALVVFCFKATDINYFAFKYIYKNYPEKTQVFYQNQNLFTIPAALEGADSVLVFNYYIRPQTSITHVDDFSEIPSKKIPGMDKYIIVNNTLVDVPAALAKNNIPFERKYRTYKDFLFEHFNQSNWLNRGDCWVVYELKQ